MKPALAIIAILLLGSALYYFSRTTAKQTPYPTNKSKTVRLPFDFKTPRAELLSIKAFAIRERGHYDSAIVLYRKAIRIEPGNPRLYFDLSGCYSEKNAPRRVIALLDTAIMLDSSYSPFFNNRGLFYYYCHEYPHAIRDLEKAVSLDSASVPALINLTLAYYTSQQMDKACEYYKKAKKSGFVLKTGEYEDKLIFIDAMCK